jgi:hypothetical protein
MEPCHADRDAPDVSGARNVSSGDEGYPRGVLMPFTLSKDRSSSAIDSTANSRMSIESGPQIEYKKVMFASPDISPDFGIEIRRKFPDQPVVTSDLRNPCVMIRSEDLNAAFAKRGMQDFERNTRLVEYLVRMVAFINMHQRLANAPFLWSNYEQLTPARWLYRMPSDEELVRISLHPEQAGSSPTEA